MLEAGRVRCVMKNYLVCDASYNAGLGIVRYYHVMVRSWEGRSGIAGF